MPSGQGLTDWAWSSWIERLVDHHIICVALQRRADLSRLDLPIVGCAEWERCHRTARVYRRLLRRLIRRVEDDRVRVAIGESKGASLNRDLRARKDEDVFGGDAWTVEFGNLFAKIQAAAIGRVAEIVVIVRVDQRAVASREREFDELRMRERLSVRVG